MAEHHEIEHHEQGTMDITYQQKTFANFIRWAMWVSIVSILILIFMALTNA